MYKKITYDGEHNMEVWSSMGGKSGINISSNDFEGIKYLL